MSIISAPASFGLLKRGVSNWLALLTVVGVLSTLVVAMIFVVMGSIGSFTANADHYRQQLVEEQNKVSAMVSGWIPDAFRLDESEAAEGRPGAVEAGDSSNNPMTDGADNTGSEPEPAVTVTAVRDETQSGATSLETGSQDGQDESPGIGNPVDPVILSSKSEQQLDRPTGLPERLKKSTSKSFLAPLNAAY